MTNTFEELKGYIEQQGRSYDLDMIGEAYRVAELAHGEQKRASGEPYIIHPLNVAQIVVSLGMDSESVEAALLHDVVEDTDLTQEDISRQFGQPVADMVDGVTKLRKIPFSSREEQQAENVRKMLLAMAKDVRVIIIKLADRLHNLRTLDYVKEQSRRDKALETMEVYAPIANRLGMTQIKEELEDLALKFLDPVGYAEIERMLDFNREAREAFLQKVVEKLHARLEPEHPHIQIYGRVKSIYGIYRKVYMQAKSFEEIYDIYAVRTIVNTVNECYNILGIIHDIFTPLPGRFKDYISTPKQNLYQSLHTTVIDKEGIPFEVQIRTWDMHYTAEYGIAAHWKYKEGIQGHDKLEERLSWIRQLLENQKDSEEAREIVSSIKTDLAPEEVFVFTPKGDVVSLPSGSTVIDFAYAIHSAVGNRMVGAKVDGRIVSLDTRVQTGNIVEIITTNAQGHGPSRDWLAIVRTTEARNKIRQWFKKERKEENTLQGRAEIEREFKRNYISLPEEQMQEFLSYIAQRQRCRSVDEFYAAIGYGGISLSRIMPRIKEDYNKTYRTGDNQNLEALLNLKPKRARKVTSGVIVEELDGCLVKYARCCNPLPGDEIVGFVTRGFGVSIHKADCANVQNAMGDQSQAERWVKARWASVVKERFKTTIEIYADDRESLLADISIALANMHLQIHALNAKELKDHHTGIQITFETTDLEQLNMVLGGLRQISGVLSVQRAVQ
ncbi:MAG: bifunctional (p)ppGpp synthetase/guanosine-3',5'-bis(diphosphate) 3'-pyrophosphohydrolase [Provencibacterium sp.]|jgi:guanosine-3',5'-bis(diphosphate) 3'-pyrophosphohydrolase|nr:bifunctional (p)ppGpp synthetase/guanosine-3',5'-bis(diphosphate) 3'-pyrophosphohydrolase [Provencibacterium sp.]